MISRKLVVFLTSLVIYCGVHTVVADPVISDQRPNIQVRPLSQALVNPMPARQLASSDSSKYVGSQIRNAYQAAVGAKTSVSIGNSAERPVASGGATTVPGPWSSKSKNVTAAPVYKAQPKLQKISATGGDLEIRLRNNGTLRWIGISKGSVRNSLSAIGKNLPPENIARDFLNKNQPLLGIENPSTEFELDSVHVDALGTQHLRFQQVYEGVPVWGRQLLAQVTNRGDLTSLVGSYSPTPRKLVLKPTIDSNAALSNARQIYDPRSLGGGRTKGLVIVAGEKSTPKLVWQCEVNVSALEKWLVFIDAHTGDRVNAINQINTENVVVQGTDLFGQVQVLSGWQEAGVYYLIDTVKPMFDPLSVPLDINNTSGAIYVGDYENSETSISFVFSLTGPNGPWLPDGISAAAHLSASYDYFLNLHGRDSLDGAGGNIYGLVRYGFQQQNAFFDGSTQYITFGDGDTYAGSLDVVAHEATHGIVAHSARLQYQNQPGALNESFSDIFGEMVEASTTGQPDWKIGTDLSAPLRDMANPGSLLSFLGRPYPSKLSEYEFTSADYGGVHVNSSIINHAFYQLAEALPNAIGITDAARIFYRTLTTKLTPLSDFYDARFSAILSAEELFGQGSAQALATGAAFDAVEIFDAPSNPLPAPTPEVIGPDSTLFTYWDPNAAAYFLGRLEPDFDPPQGSQLSVGPIYGPRASVDGAGEIAVFVNDQNDVCFIATGGGIQESCSGLTGQVGSVAMAADGDTYGLVLLDAQGNPTNRITVVDFATETTVEYVLEAPVFDGVSSIQVVQADAMDFTNDSRFLVYDAFNVADFGGSVMGVWSLYAIDLLSGTTFPLIAPTPDFDTAYPSVAQTSDGHMTFDAFDLINNENIVATADVYSGQTVGLVISGQNYSIPSYTGDDGAVVFSSEDVNVPTGGNLWQIPLASDRITPTAGPTLWLQNAVAGSIYRRGIFEGSSRVDLTAEFEDLQPVVGHQVMYRVRLTNNGPDAANTIRIVITVPEGVTVDQVDGAFQCTSAAEGQQAQCDIPGPLRTPDLDGSLTVQIVVNALDVAPFTTSVTAFAEETDSNSADNTAFLDVPASLQNYSPELDQAISDQVTQEGRSFSLNVSGNFSDRDQDVLTFSATGLPASLTIGSDSGQISGTLTSADVQNTSYAVTVTAADPFGGEVQGSFNLTVNAAPPPPPPPSGGGGGGGSAGLIMLMLLGSVYAFRRRERVFS